MSRVLSSSPEQVKGEFRSTLRGFKTTTRVQMFAVQTSMHSGDQMGLTANKTTKQMGLYLPCMPPPTYR